MSADPRKEDPDASAPPPSAAPRSGGTTPDPATSPEPASGPDGDQSAAQPGDGDGAGKTAPQRGGAVVLLRETALVIGTALVLSLLIKTFLVQAFFIPSESMERTLLRGDRVLVSRLTPGPFELQRGDVVVFKDPGGWLVDGLEPERGPLADAAVRVLTFVGVLPQDAGEHLIKRIIGMPGDHVVCCDDDGRLTVNGVAVDEESYLAPGASPSEREFDVVVPPGRLWVMGDNRQNSRDSRWHVDREDGGTVAVDSVVGEAFVIIWPLSRWSGLGVDDSVFAGVPDSPPAPAERERDRPGGSGQEPDDGTQDEP